MVRDRDAIALGRGQDDPDLFRRPALEKGIEPRPDGRIRKAPREPDRHRRLRTRQPDSPDVPDEAVDQGARARRPGAFEGHQHPRECQRIVDGTGSNLRRLDGDPTTDAVAITVLPALRAPLRRNGLVLIGIHCGDDRDAPGRHQQPGLEQLVRCPRRHLPKRRHLHLAGPGFHRLEQQIHGRLSQRGHRCRRCRSGSPSAGGTSRRSGAHAGSCP